MRLAAFLANEFIFQARDVPYKTQLVPLATIFVALGDEAESAGVVEKLRRWFWCGVLGELYSGTTDTRFARDLEEVLRWLDQGPEPSTVGEANFNENRLLTLKTRNSAAYKGIYALLMRDGCQDWWYDHTISTATFFDQKLDIHHIFPKKWCDENSIDKAKRESIVNKTAISYKTNRSIGGRAPSKYLPIVESRAGITPSQLDERVSRHEVDPALLRADDFPSFFDARQVALQRLITEAMGKPVQRAVVSDSTEDFEEELEDLEDPEDEGLEEAS